MKIRKRALLLVLLVFPFAMVNAQQEAQFVHNMFNGIFLIPVLQVLSEALVPSVLPDSNGLVLKMEKATKWLQILTP